MRWMLKLWKIMTALPVVGFKVKHMQSCEAKQEVGKDERVALTHTEP